MSQREESRLAAEMDRLGLSEENRGAKTAADPDSDCLLCHLPEEENDRPKFGPGSHAERRKQLGCRRARRGPWGLKCREPWAGMAPCGGRHGGPTGPLGRRMGDLVNGPIMGTMARQRGCPRSRHHSSGADSGAEAVEEKRVRRQRRVEECREMRRARRAATVAGNCSEQDADDSLSFLPPWVRRVILMKERMGKAEGSTKERIRKKMRHLMMKRWMLAQHQQQMMIAPWWCQVMMGGAPCPVTGSPLMLTHFGMQPSSTIPGHGRHFGHAHRVPIMRWEPKDLDSDNQKSDSDAEQAETAVMAVDEETKNKEDVTGKSKAEAELTSSLSSDENSTELPPALPPWTTHFIRSKKEMSRPRGSDGEVEEARQRRRRWARRWMATSSAPWGLYAPFDAGAPTISGNFPMPPYHSFPAGKRWMRKKAITKQSRSAAKKANNKEAETKDLPRPC